MVQNKKIGCLGLSADPPHNGHLEMAQLILKKKVVDDLWLIPCYEHPFGKSLAPSEHRWEMTLLLESKEIQATNVEFRKKGKSYTIETVKALKKEYPCRDFFWIIGSDIVNTKSYEWWKDWRDLLSLVDFLVVPRAGFKVKKMPPGFILVKGKISDISSAEIRERVRKRLPIKGLVPKKVKEYIEKHNLYKA